MSAQSSNSALERTRQTAARRSTRTLGLAVKAPAGFRRWQCHWFQCPACGHRSFQSFFNLDRDLPGRMPLRFWCDRCDEHSTLRPPYFQALLGLMAIVLGAGLFVVLYSAMTDSLFGLPVHWAVALWVGLMAISPLLICGLSRMTNRYAHVPRVEP